MSNFPTPGVYNIDTTHSSLSFIVRHLLVSKVRGGFTEFEGTITVGDTPETSSVSVTAQAASFSTNNADRDNHVKSADFLEVEANPTLTFNSTSLTAKGGNEYALVGDLTIKGVTKSVTFDVEFNGQGEHAYAKYFSSVIGFEAKATIDRRDFNVNVGANEITDSVVSHKIDLVLEVEATLPAAQA